MTYYILCKRHGYKKDHAMLFWGPNNQGYFYDLNKAGLYTSEQASKFPYPTDDKPIALDLIESMAIESIIENNCIGKIVLNTEENRLKVGTKLKELNAGSTNWDSGAFCSIETFMNKNKNTVQMIEEIKNRNK